MQKNRALATFINNIKRTAVNEKYLSKHISPNYGNFEKLTYAQIEDEIKRCRDVDNKTGFLYFALNFGWMQHPVFGAVKMKESFYGWQARASQLYLCTEQVVSKKTRQVGFSAFTGMYALWRALFFESQNICIVSISARESKTFLDRIKFSYDYLPYWMQQEKTEDKKTTFTFESNKSKITSLPMTSDPARGDSISLLILDEFATYKNAEDVLASSVPALSAGSGFEFSNEALPSQMFIISTYPKNPIDNEYLRILNEARADESSDILIVDVDTSDIRHYQDPDWHKKQLAILGQRRYNTEIKGVEPNESESAFLSEDVLNELSPESPIRCDFLYPESIDENGFPLEMEKFEEITSQIDMKFGYIRGLWIWVNPIPGRQYIMVCDIASGHLGDHSAFIVMDPETNEEVAEFYSNKINTELFKEIIWEVCQYYNNSKLSIENTGLGLPICEYFGSTLMYENFYFTQKNKSTLMPGFTMAVNSRANGIAYFGSSMERRELKLKSLRLIQELRAFGYAPNGRIQALGKAHDDLVMCLVQYAWLQQHGWAASDAQLEDSMIFGKVEIPNEEDEIRRNKIRRYWEESFDIDYDSVSDQKKELLNILQATGAPMTQELLAYLNDDYY